MGSEQVIALPSEEDRRIQQLAAAKKKLSNFRARGSDSQTAFSFPAPAVPPLPLTTELSDNCPRPPKGKEPVGELDKAFKMDNSHRRQGSSSMGHRRRPSSISISHSAVPLRTSVTGLFDGQSPSNLGTSHVESEGHDLPLFSTSNTATPTPPNPTSTYTSSAPPLRDEDPVTPVNNADDTARAKFTSFSFGSKPSPRSDLSTPVTTLREREPTNRTSPNHSPRPSLSAPGSLFTNRLSTPLSRPPSLLVTRPTPLHEALGSAPLSQTPPSPPTPARKRHSHTRSNSISMPNLKLGRPQSYNVLSSSPSFPSSPVSPDGLAPEAPVTQGRAGNGRKLKFEPSGRGAEAEQLRDESRRKALEKLTGKKSPTIPPPLEAEVAEISLPSMDDEEDDNETVTSESFMAQADPERSGLRSSHGQTSSFGRHDSLTDTSPILPSFTPTRASPPPIEQWSQSQAKSEREEFLGLGIGLDNAALKRASMPSALGVLTEEDESEENTTRAEISIDYDTYSTGPVEKEETPVPPTPSRLRELHLVSSSVHASPSRSEDASHALNRSLSETPTNPLGSGRRPRPLSGLGHAAFGAPSSSPSTTTPKSASALLSRRRSAGSGSRGSSISYRKDKEESGGSSTGSSREWSFGRIASPTALSGFGSPPPLSASAQFSTWPRPEYTTRGYEDIEELASPIQSSSSRWSKCPPSSSTPTATIDRGSTDRYSSSMNESSDFSWRDSRLELEMEKDAWREDAELWKTRCLSAEEHLKAERSETAILRERVRKLGDRLSSVSSSHLPLSTQPTDELRPLNEMRDQLFSLMSLVEREQREKQEAIARISELENQLLNIQFQSQSSATAFRPVLPSQAFGQLMPAPPSPIITPATPLPSSPAPSSPSEANGSRMKSWGFPSTRKTPTPPKEKRRESFFGLSTALRGPPVLEEHSGIDLPPISLPDSMPMAKERSRDSQAEPPVAPLIPRSSSMTSSGSSVVHFFSGYLGRGKSTAYAGDDSRKGVLDLRGGCSCCTGEVFEL